jgi:hypothetical protein
MTKNGWFAMLSQGAGYTDGTVRGIGENRARVEMNFGGKGHVLLDPSHQVIEQTESGTRVGVVLPPHVGDGYLEHVAKKYGGYVGSVERGPLSEPTWYKIVLGGTVFDCRRLAAKLGLGAGAIQWGDDFVISPLADWLRVVLDV